MRSRYSAFALGDIGYLKASWHADFRPPELSLDANVRWLGLEVMQFTEQDRCATVEFEARYLVNGQVDAVHEKSRFVLEQGRWLYTDGDRLPPRFQPWKPGRNEPCPCGSGKKFKRCCAGRD